MIEIENMNKFYTIISVKISTVFATVKYISCQIIYLMNFSLLYLSMGIQSHSTSIMYFNVRSSTHAVVAYNRALMFYLFISTNSVLAKEPRQPAKA